MKVLELPIIESSNYIKAVPNKDLEDNKEEPTTKDSNLQAEEGQKIHKQAMPIATPQI